MTQPNPSTAQARSIADELARHGVAVAMISPGSRSAALAIAFEEHPGFETRVILDERSAAFQALGHARATGSPAVCVATSGTAGANYLPAIVEADLSLAPMIVITADRPAELRHVGANQTIEQTGLFGNRVRWFCEVGLADPATDNNTYWRSTVSQAVAHALGFGLRPGPVHLNIPFREPTAPVADDGRSASEPYRFPIEGRPKGRPWQEHRRDPGGGVDLSEYGRWRGLVVVGDHHSDAQRLLTEAKRLGWPVLGTALSGTRADPDVITSYHHLLVEGVPPHLEPEVVISVGAVGPSDRLGHLTRLDIPQIQLNPWGVWHDPRRHGSMMVRADPAAALASIPPLAGRTWRDVWRESDRTMRSALEEGIFESGEMTGPSIARCLSELDWSILVAASSMPIRDVDAHMTRGGRVVGNRGASGIDGFSALSLGVARAVGRTVALSGDLSFLHDLTSLIIDDPPGLVLIVVDNNGGGLFDLLPHASHAPAFDRLFIAPHNRDLTSLSQSLGIDAGKAGTVETLSEVAGRGLDRGGLHVVVVPVDREADLKARRRLDDVAREVLDSFS